MFFTFVLSVVCAVLPDGLRLVCVLLFLLLCFVGGCLIVWFRFPLLCILGFCCVVCGVCLFFVCLCVFMVCVVLCACILSLLLFGCVVFLAVFDFVMSFVCAVLNDGLSTTFCDFCYFVIVGVSFFYLCALFV